MNRFIYSVVSLAACGITTVGATGNIVPLSPAQTILVWAQAKDPAVAQGIEFHLQSLLADRQIVSERYSKAFPLSSDSPPHESISKMRQLSMNALMILQPIGNIRWPSQGISSLEQFLTTTPGKTNPVDLTPQSGGSSLPQSVAPPARGPIPGNQGPSTEQIMKIRLILFDVDTGKMIWKGRIPIRGHADMPTSDYQQRVAEEAIGVLDKEGLISHRR